MKLDLLKIKIEKLNPFQDRSKTKKGVKATYLPTGTVVSCDAFSAYYKNKEEAIKLLEEKVFESA